MKAFPNAKRMLGQLLWRVCALARMQPHVVRCGGTCGFPVNRAPLATEPLPAAARCRPLLPVAAFGIKTKLFPPTRKKDDNWRSLTSANTQTESIYLSRVGQIGCSVCAACCVLRFWPPPAAFVGLDAALNLSASATPSHCLHRPPTLRPTQLLSIAAIRAGIVAAAAAAADSTLR